MIKKWRNRIESESQFLIWGMFYFNLDDPRIIVPKRIEWLGWTLNFAHPESRFILAGVFLAILLNIIIALLK